MLLEKNCKKCNKKFISPTGKSNFCSHYCRTKGWSKICKNCKKHFLGSYESIFCSRICSGKFNVTEQFSQRSKLSNNESKKCNKCKEYKKYNEFREVTHKNARGWKDPSGRLRYSHCKNCESLDVQNRYRNKPWIQIYSSRKKHAKKNGIPFSITQNDLKKLYENIPDRCPVLGEPFERSIVGGSNRKRTYSPSLDRIEPSKGYVPGNLLIISDLANRIKQDATVDQIEKVFKFYKKLYKK